MWIRIGICNQTQSGEKFSFPTFMISFPVLKTTFNHLPFYSVPYNQIWVITRFGALLLSFHGRYVIKLATKLSHPTSFQEKKKKHLFWQRHTSLLVTLLPSNIFLKTLSGLSVGGPLAPLFFTRIITFLS